MEKTHGTQKLQHAEENTIDSTIELRRTLRRLVSFSAQQTSVMPGNFDAFVPFSRIPITENAYLYLGNDAVREMLLKQSNRGNASIVLRDIGLRCQADAAGLMASFGLQGAPTSYSMSQADGHLDKVKLMISVNHQTKSSQQVYQPMTCVEGMRHVWAPISENDEKIFPNIFWALLGNTNAHISEAVGVTPFHELFSMMDSVFASGNDVFLHCNQGEHRSASVAVLYAMSRAEVPYECAWMHIQRYRRIIKTLVAKRANLMTEFFRFATPAPPAWDCSACTLHNEGIHTACEVCGNPAPALNRR